MSFFFENHTKKYVDLYKILCAALGIHSGKFLYGSNMDIILFLLYVAISNIDDKRQITGTYFVSLKKEFLPPQFIYQGKTPACHSKHVKFPDGFYVTQTEKH